ncbi:MAG TPA: hypothetical protein DCL81_15790 [Algoriphagus sp.]|jgi:hypothetical protein|nr:hypothetical protein [Algoriphagus sp.]|tara:strand:+ start:879 stop:1091 length:213 start_codon:yes stop_codon:yes gene_type:complete
MNDTVKRNNSIYSPRYCDKMHEKIDKEFRDVWDHNKTQDDRLNGIFTRINLILGGVVVALIMLVINIYVK